jgi:hypothetical protein
MSTATYPHWAMMPRNLTGNVLTILFTQILTSNMADKVVNQVGHWNEAKEVWEEARCLYSGQMITNWTMIITSLVMTKFTDREDVTTHISKMKLYRWDLIMMGCNMDNDLSSCFLHISMPPGWNYVFAGLLAKYTTAEVKWCIKDKYGIRANQQSTASAYRTKPIKFRWPTLNKSHVLKPGEPFYNSCENVGHWVWDCWAPGGGAEGQGPYQKKNKEKWYKKATNKGRGKEKAKANRARDSKPISDPETDTAPLSYLASTHSHPELPLTPSSSIVEPLLIYANIIWHSAPLPPKIPSLGA